MLYYPLMPPSDTVSWEIMPGDHMYKPGGEAHYEAVGASAIRAMFAAIILADVGQPQSVLDFGCGSGRVARWLPKAFPGARIDVSDTRVESLAFCELAFGVGSWPSADDLSSLQAPTTYDLIWSGSLLTHLSEAKSCLLLGKFADWLNPNGMVVFTLHGRRVLSNLVSGRHTYIAKEAREPILRDLALRGYGYMQSGPSRDIGFSMNTLQWIVAAAAKTDLRVVTISEHAWDGHQDVIALQRI